jgi:hypothetical protein
LHRGKRRSKGGEHIGIMEDDEWYEDWKEVWSEEPDDIVEE